MPLGGEKGKSPAASGGSRVGDRRRLSVAAPSCDGWAPGRWSCWAGLEAARFNAGGLAEAAHHSAEPSRVWSAGANGAASASASHPPTTGACGYCWKLA